MNILTSPGDGATSLGEEDGKQGQDEISPSETGEKGFKKTRLVQNSGAEFLLGRAKGISSRDNLALETVCERE